MTDGQTYQSFYDSRTCVENLLLAETPPSLE